MSARLGTADLIPYDVERIAHELWDYAEILTKRASVPRTLGPHRFGPASSVQKAPQSLDARDILDRYRGEFFFLDRLLLC